MSTRRESIHVTALVLLLLVVGVSGASWTDDVSAQERAVLSRPPMQADAPIPGGTDVLIAIGTLQLVGVLVFEMMAYARRRSLQRPATPPLFWRVPTSYQSLASRSTSRSHQAA
jgi:hypothetical protein